MDYKDIDLDELKRVILSRASHVPVWLRPKVLYMIDRIKELEKARKEKEGGSHETQGSH